MCEQELGTRLCLAVGLTSIWEATITVVVSRTSDLKAAENIRCSVDNVAAEVVQS